MSEAMSKTLPPLPEDIQKQARLAVNRAVKSGRLVRPDICQHCGKTPKRGSDGRSLIQGHHKDYSKPLDVEWICAKCHRKETPLPAVMGRPNLGEQHGGAKLTDDAVRNIRNSNMSSRKLAEIYSVDHKTILRARNREQWRHV